MSETDPHDERDEEGTDPTVGTPRVGDADTAKGEMGHPAPEEDVVAPSDEQLSHEGAGEGG